VSPKRVQVNEETAGEALPQDYADRQLSVAKRRSRPQRKTYYLTEDLAGRIEALAVRRGISASDIVKLGMDEYLRGQGV
jgi:hypothetical protein